MRKVVRIAREGAGGRTAGGINAKQRVHAQIACGQKVEVGRAGADHAEAGAATDHLFGAGHCGVAVGQTQVTGLRIRLQQAAVGRSGIGASHQAHGPGLRAFGQHGRHGPELPLAARVLDAQLHRRRTTRQLDVGARRQQRATRQRLAAIEDHGGGGAQVAGQWHALGPDHGLHTCQTAQQGAGVQGAVGRQGHALAQQGARSKQHIARGIPYCGRQHRASGYFQSRGQGRRDRQPRAGDQVTGLDRQVEVEDDARRERGAVGQGHAAARHHRRAAGVVNAGAQHPAIVIGGRWRRCKTIVDAAVDGQVTAGAQGQATGLPRTADVVDLLVVRVDAGVAVARQVQVARYHDIAARIGHGIAHDLDAGTQMKGIGKARIAQAGQLAGHETGARCCGVDEVITVVVLVLEPGLGDLLVGPPAGSGRADQRRIVVALHAVDRDGASAADVEHAARVDGDVAVDRRIAGIVQSRQTVRADARRREFERAARAAVVQPRCAAHGHTSAVTQVDAHAVSQRQLTGAGTQVDDGAVGCIDDFAVAVHAQLAAMGVQHRAAVQRQAMLASQRDAADPCTAGIHQTRDPQAAVIHRHVDAAGLESVSDAQVALLELEAAGAVDLALVQSFVEGSELVAQGATGAQALGLDLHRTGKIGHQGAAGIVVTAATGQDLACQIDRAGSAVHGHRPQLAGLVVLRRQVDARTRRLQYVARAAVQAHLATRAVLGQIVEGDGAAGHIDRCRVGQHHVAARAQRELAAGQHHGAGQADAVTLQRQLRAQAIGLAGGASRSGDFNGAACGDAVHRAGLARHQRGQDAQVATAVGIALEGVVHALALVDREAAPVVGGDAFARRQLDVGKSQGQAVEGLDGAGLGKLSVAELDALGVDVQPPAASAGATRHHRGGRRRGTLPDQVGGVDGGHVTGPAVTIDRRGGKHQLTQQGLAGHRVVGVQRGGAVEIEAVARRELQGFQCRRAELRVAAQQAVQHGLSEGQAGGQAIAGRCGGQRLRAADVDAGQAQVEVTGAVAHFIAHCQGLVGHGNDAALGIQGGLPAARLAAAHAQADAAAGLHVRRAGHVEQAVGHGQHVAHLVDIAISRIIAGLATADGVDRRPLFHDDRARRALAHHEHLRCRQLRSCAQDHGAVAGVDALGLRDDVAGLSVLERGHAADHQPCGADAIETVGIHADAAETIGSGLACSHHFDAAVIHVQQCDAASVAAGRSVEATDALEGEGVRAGARSQRQLQGSGIDRQHRPRHAQSRRVRDGKLRIPGFVVLGVTAQGVGGGQRHLAGQAVADAGMGSG